MPKNRTLLGSTLFMFFLLLVGGIISTNYTVSAEDCDDIEDLDDRYECLKKEEESTSKKLADIRKEKNSVTEKITGLLGQLTVTQSELDGVQSQITTLISTLEEINKNLLEKNAELEDKISFRNKVIRNYSKRGFMNQLEVFMSSERPSDLTGFQFSSFTYIFEKALSNEARRLIASITTQIDAYERDKAEAEDLKTELETAQNQLIAAVTQLEADKRISEEDLNVLAEQESSYEQKLAEISSQQQSILAKKSGGTSGTVGDYDQVEVEVPEPNFSPAFGFFSYGAHTHYRGMSQFGAKGRAEDGQSYEDIIEFYYQAGVDENDDFPDDICVQGYGDMDFQQYLYGLGEMPSDWPEDALMAQAIAARTYANRYKKAGTCICTTESCQVFIKSKSDNPPARWKEAVDATEGMIIDDDSAHGMYSSTTGGFIDEGVGWDTDGSWPNAAYEKKANSPWFYWAWYSGGYKMTSDTCGRDGPWLNKEEMADILNSWVVWRKGSSDDREHISPLTTNCWDGDPWSMDKMADKADDLDKKYTSVGDIDVNVGNNGFTTQITLQTNHGSLSIDGQEFKTVFNLRAPGYISIKSRLYDAQYRN